jgi:small-conductance mechanosensitive channel
MDQGIFTFSLINLLSNFNLQSLNYEIFTIGDYSFRVYTLLHILVIILTAKVFIWFIKRFIFHQRKQNTMDLGNAFSLFQISKYIIWVITIALVLEAIGVNVTVLLAGSAALLVGIGLGLQQTFNDFISGIILLTEGTTKVGDVLEVEGDVVIVQSIGLRTSKVLNRDEIVILLPNSLMTNNKVINWSHQSKKTRFKINVGVAYGTDVDLVMRILEESVREYPGVTEKETVKARFVDFGDSSLDFQVLFFSEEIFRIGGVLSDIRVIINRKFIENNITIPFPQRDLHIKSGNLMCSKDKNPT